MDPAPGPSLQRRLAEIVGIAAAYFATGKLGLFLALPPGYATAIWPPSGIALSALLLLGSRAAPGIFIGSFLVNLSMSSDRDLAPLGVAAALGAGATVQAHLGAILIRRFVGMPLELLRGRDIVRFLLLGGPASCTVAATAGTATLWFQSRIQLAEIPFHWWTWWVGDVIGVAVVAPLVLIAFGQPREIWRRRVVPVAIPLVLLFLGASGLFFLVSAWERERIASQFRIRTEATAAATRDRLAALTELLEPLKSFHAATPRFDREAFRKFVEGPLSKFPSVQALSWNPRVSDAERDLFERGGPDGSAGLCRITERDAKERLVPASRREEYFPVRYIEPYEANAGVVGFDVSSAIVRFEALKLARDTGQPAATRRIRLLQESEPSAGILIYLPVYSRPLEPDTPPEERRRCLTGYFAAVLQVEQFFDWLDSVSGTEGYDIAVRYADELPGPDLIWFASAANRVPAGIQNTSQFPFAGRTWAMTFRASPTYVSSFRSWKPWGVLAAGMSVAGLLGAILLSLTGRR